MIFGIILISVYNLCDLSAYVSLKLFKNIEILTPIISSFAFTLLGTLIAILTLLFSLFDVVAFKNFKDKGYLNLFFHCIYADALYLTMTFAFSITSISKNVVIFYAMYTFFIGSIFLTLLIIWVLVGLFRRKFS